MKRTQTINFPVEHVFDLAVIGGGITGAGILWEAAKRGYRCLLVEKNDFAGGTSSKSAKLVHGGLRYLKYGKFSLVREGLRERHFLLKNFPHLVKPLPFLFPVYKSKLKLHIGMWLYKILSFDKDLAKFEFLNKQQTIKKFPAVNTQNLKGSFIFYDAVTNDARLCNEVIFLAQQCGGTALNYCEFTGLKQYNENYSEVFCHDKIENSGITFKTKYIVNATGPWTDETLRTMNCGNTALVAPSKGVHLVFQKNKFPTETAILFDSYNNDGRTMYAVPWENETVIVGTTDTEKFQSSDGVKADSQDIQYILNSIARFAPSLNISKTDIISAYAGLRPLLHNDIPSKDRTRDYKCEWTASNILTIAGGKFTSFHAMANTVIQHIEQKEKKIKEERCNMTKVDIAFSGFQEEIIFYIRCMNCKHLDDILTRRLSLTYVMNQFTDNKRRISSVANIMKEELNWTDVEMKNEIENYCAINHIN